MYETAIDLLESGSIRTLAERFSIGINETRSRYKCSMDVEEGDLVYLDDEGLIRPVRSDECSPFMAVCAERMGDEAVVVSGYGSVLTLPYEGNGPSPGDTVYAGGGLIKGSVSLTPRKYGAGRYRVGVVQDQPEGGLVQVLFHPRLVA